MKPRRLGRTDLDLTPIGYGAFKIGRNTGTKFDQPYDLPSDEASDRLLRFVIDDLCINYIDTAPAYGVSEERVGRIAGNRRDVVISTKVGERYDASGSQFDFSHAAVKHSVSTSMRRLQREVLDLVFIHSSGDDLHVLQQTDVVETLIALKAQGAIRWIGMSSKTPHGALASMSWADVLMIEYHLQDHSHANAMSAANERGIGIIVKKGLASGRLPSRQAISFVLQERAVTSLVIGGLSVEHLRSNVATAIETVRT